MRNQLSSPRRRVIPPGGVAMIDCSHCVDLLRDALEASKIYHHLLEDLEAAHIRHDTELCYRLHAQEAKTVLKRDNAIMALSDHEHTHAKGA